MPKTPALSTIISRELKDHRKATPKVVDKFLDKLAEHGGLGLAAAQVSLSYDAIRDWRKVSPAFSMACTRSIGIDAANSLKHLNKLQTSKSDAVALNAVKTKLAANPLTKADFREGHTPGEGGQGINIQINVDRSWNSHGGVDPMEPVDGGVTVDHLDEEHH